MTGRHFATTGRVCREFLFGLIVIFSLYCSLATVHALAGNYRPIKQLTVLKRVAGQACLDSLE